jgi:hypothetical protein
MLISTALSCAKDAYAPLKDAMKSLAGHDWTTQGLIDLARFLGLGVIFMKTRFAEKIDPNRLIAGLIGAVGGRGDRPCFLVCAILSEQSARLTGRLRRTYSSPLPSWCCISR